jgi:hypothetical protein
VELRTETAVLLRPCGTVAAVARVLAAVGAVAVATTPIGELTGAPPTPTLAPAPRGAVAVAMAAAGDGLPTVAERPIPVAVGPVAVAVAPTGTGGWRPQKARRRGPAGNRSGGISVIGFAVGLLRKV